MKFTHRISSAFVGAMAGFVTGKAISPASFLRGDEGGSSAARRLSEPFAQSAYVRAAVNHVADEIAGRPLKFYAGDNEFSALGFAEWWAYPALGPKTDGQESRLSIDEVQRDLASWSALEGEFFLCFDDEWAVSAVGRKGQLLSPFLIARPDRIQFIVCRGVLEGYRYTDAAGRQILFLPSQVIHRKRFNPYDDWRGLGDLAAARVAAEGAFLTGAYIRDLARNNGDQGFIVIGKGGQASPEQQAQIVADLRAKRAALSRGVAKDLFLSGADISIDRPKQEAASGELTASKALSQQEIFVAFGVPPSMAEVKASYSIGKDSDYYQLITRTCMPRGAFIASAFAKVASMQTGQILSAELEWDDHPVMREVRQARVETGLKLWGVGMPMEGVNDYLDLGMEPFAGWDVGYLPFSVSAVGATPEPAADPSLAEPADVAEPTGDEPPAVSALRLAAIVRQRQAAPAPQSSAPCTCGCGDGTGALVNLADRDPREVALWKKHTASRREIVKSFASTFSRLLMQARAETLQRIEARGAVKSPVVARAAAEDLVFNLDGWKSKLVAALRKAQENGLTKAAQTVLDELGKADDPWKMAPKEVTDFLAGRQKRIGDVADEVWARVRDTLQEGLDGGDTMAELAGRVRAECNGIDAGRAMVIAQTETSAAYGAGRQAAMQGAGVQWKRWLSSGNTNVRSAHAEANGQTVPIDEAFVVGGEFLRHPGDSEGSPQNVINCHCVSIAVADGPTE